MPRTTPRLIAGILLIPALLASAIVACCMVPTSYPGDVDQTRQDGVIFFHEGHEELVLRVQPTFPDFDYGPARLQWIVTVPSKPAAYREVPAEVFEEAKSLYRRLERLAGEQKPRMPMTLSASAPKSASGALEVSAAIRVGPYEITEVLARGQEGALELNRYLQEREFPAESPEELAWFVDREFTFLCIDIHPPEGAKRFGKDLELPALQIGFETDRPYYPAKYSARQGDFALALNVFTTEPLDRDAFYQVQKRLRSRGSHYTNLFTAKPLPPHLGAVAYLCPGTRDIDRWYVNPVTSWGFNPTDDQGVPAIMKWEDDVFFSLGDASDGPPSWYYGDGSRSLRQRVASGEGVAILGVLGVVGLVVFLRRRRRK